MVLRPRSVTGPNDPRRRGPARRVAGPTETWASVFKRLSVGFEGERGWDEFTRREERVSEREVLSLEPIGDVPEVGRWLSAMEDSRRDTLHELEGVPDDALDWEVDARTNTIGTLLYRVALVEDDWLFADTLEAPDHPRRRTDLFPYADRVEDERLSPEWCTPLRQARIPYRAETGGRRPLRATRAREPPTCGRDRRRPSWAKRSGRAHPRELQPSPRPPLVASGDRRSTGG